MVLCVVLLCVFTFWVPCCYVLYDFSIKTLFGSSLPPVVCRRAHVLFTLFLFVCVKWCPTHIMLVLFLFFFVYVLCTLCCQLLWIVYFWLSLRYSLTFIYTFATLLRESGQRHAHLQAVVSVKSPTKYKTLVQCIGLLQSKPWIAGLIIIPWYRWIIALGV